MSDTMLFGVLKMPYELTMNDEISRRQFYQRVQELISRVEAQPEQEPCVGKDPRCPCQDGDACHYKDCGDTKARPVAQPEQEPVAWAVQGTTQMIRGEFAELDAKSKAKRIGGTCVAYPLYTAPPQRSWVGLTDDEIDSCWYQSGGVTPGFARTVEAKLKEKNDH